MCQWRCVEARWNAPRGRQLPPTSLPGTPAEKHTRRRRPAPPRRAMRSQNLYARRGFLYRVFTPGAEDGGMDVVAIALGVVMFVILLSLIEGIDRV